MECCGAKFYHGHDMGALAWTSFLQNRQVPFKHPTLHVSQGEARRTLGWNRRSISIRDTGNTSTRADQKYTNVNKYGHVLKPKERLDLRIHEACKKTSLV